MLQRKTTILARVLLAVVVVATPIYAGGVCFQKTDKTAPSVSSTVVLGSTVAVTVANTGRDTVVVTVQVVAVVDGTQVSGSETLSVPPREDSTATVDFGSPVDSVVTVGLTEDSTPY